MGIYDNKVEQIDLKGQLKHFIEKVHLDDLDLYVITFCCVSNISLTLIISIETY